MPNATNDFLDGSQYTENGILRYEKIFGRGFVSTGGRETTQECVKLLNLQPGQKVLDVGCGIGGSAFHMAKEYQAEVYGIDLSKNMLKIGQQRAAEFGKDRVKFEYCDITKAEFEEGSFDVIYSRDTFLHIEEKQKVFTNCLKWLKPGGQIMITDYCHGDGALSQEFKEYLKQRDYSLITVSAYGKIFKDAGYVDVIAKDNTERFIEVLNSELKRFETIKNDFLNEFSEADFNAITGGWKGKVKRCTSGDHRWVFIHAKKPAQ